MLSNTEAYASSNTSLPFRSPGACSLEYFSYLQACSHVTCNLAGCQTRGVAYAEGRHFFNRASVRVSTSTMLMLQTS